jgi:hypothetical protein
MGRAGAARSALYGRERELAMLAAAIDAAAGRQQVVTLGGPPGIGKSPARSSHWTRVSPCT